MASTQRCDKTEELNDSWVELSYDQNGVRPTVEAVHVLSHTNSAVSLTGSMEKLLIDAQQESSTPSRINSNESSHRSSPKSPASPNTEWSGTALHSKLEPSSDWIWDWSSRPEIQQSFDNVSEKFRHPGSKVGRAPFSVRNTQVMKKTRLFSWSNLPTLLVTHACTFFLGAAAVFIYLRKYCNFSSIPQVALD